jgi:hypothetical protein
MSLTDEEEEKISRWEEKFLSGDHSDDEWAMEMFRTEKRSYGAPILFDAVSQLKALIFLDQNEVDIFQRSADGSTILMDGLERYDLQTYSWLAKKFAQKGAIDWAEDEGITPLSGKIKFGELAKAKILLENGASVNSFAQIARYGDERLDLSTQAVLCSPRTGSGENSAIEALKLLREFGYDPTSAQTLHLLTKVSIDKPKLKKWIKDNL